LPPIVDFDALFVPDSPKALGQIAPMLPYVGVNKIQLLGTNLWDSQEFIRRGQDHVDGAIFVDSELSADPRFATSPFVKEFQKVFGQTPGIFETQGYEVGLALRNVISQGQHTRQELTSALANARQVQGVLGPLNINEAREFVRPMVALTVQNGQIIPLANATQKAE
jgi:ABC-type branched-subunit amino acid transport system substrate-binding protein